MKEQEYHGQSLDKGFCNKAGNLGRIRAACRKIVNAPSRRAVLSPASFLQAGPAKGSVYPKALRPTSTFSPAMALVF